MLPLTLATPIHHSEEAVTGRLRDRLRRRWLGIWKAAVRHAERPGRFVPYC